MDKWQQTKNQTGIKYKFNVLIINSFIVSNAKLLIWFFEKRKSFRNEEGKNASMYSLSSMLTCFQTRLCFDLVIFQLWSRLLNISITNLLLEPFLRGSKSMVFHFAKHIAILIAENSPYMLENCTKLSEISCLEIFRDLAEIAWFFLNGSWHLWEVKTSQNG